MLSSLLATPEHYLYCIANQEVVGEITTKYCQKYATNYLSLSPSGWFRSLG